MMRANKRSIPVMAWSVMMLTCGLTLTAVPAMAQQPSTTEPPKSDDQAANEKLPSAEEVLERHVEARGGEAVLRKHSARTSAGTFEVPGMGLSGTMRTYAAAPNHFLLEIDIPELGETRSGYNGEVGWSINQMQGPMLLEGGTLKDLKREADFYIDLNYREHFPTIEVAQRTDFNDEPCYEVRMIDKGGKETTAYFSVESGFMIGMRATAETPMGPMTSVTTLSEYKAFDDVVLPRVVSVKVMNVEQKMTIDSVSHEPIDPKVFALPAEIKALAAARNEEGASKDGEEHDDDDDQETDVDDDQDENGSDDEDDAGW